MQARSPEEVWKDIEQLKSIKKLPPPGVSYVQAALKGPSRKVGAGALFNTSGSIAAGPGQTVEYESEAGEATFVRLCVLGDVPLVLSQPPQILVRAHDRRGRWHNRYQTPDYLRVTAESVSLIEVKPLAKLERLQILCKDDWSVRRNTWSYAPGVEAAAAMGMKHEVFFPEAYTPQYRANLKYLAAIHREAKELPRKRLVDCVVQSLRDCPKTIRELTQNYLGINADDLLLMMANGVVFGLLEHQTFNLDFVLFGSEEQCHGRRAEIEAFRLKEIPAGSLTHRLAKATQRELEHAKSALRKYNERREQNTRMNSWDYRVRNGINAAIAEGAPPIAGIVPRFSERGGAGTPLREDDAKALLDYIEDYLKNLKSKPSPTEIHANLLDAWTHPAARIPCVETIRTYLAKNFTPERIAALTGGPRAIQNARRKTPGESCNERIDLAGMWAQCDAVYSDIVPKDVDEQDWILTRPIVFPMVMSSSLYIASAGIEFGSPSSLGFLMAVRLCLQENGWLAETIYNDRGPEFNSKIWSDSALVLQISTARRPIASSRSGGEIEMVNGQLNKYVQTLHGGTYHDQAGRSADRSQKGRATAMHDLMEVVRAIYRWIQIWNNTRHGNRLLTPKEQFERELAAFPQGVRRPLLDEIANYHTSYPIRAKAMTYQRGLAFSGKRFSSDVVSDLLSRGEYPTDLRVDCLNPSIIRGLTSQGLVRITSRDFHGISGMGKEQRILAMAECMRYHAVTKRNQMEYQAALARERRELREKTMRQETVPQPLGREADAKDQTQKPNTKISFAELAKQARPNLEIVKK